MPQIRPPAVAGTFYPEQPEVLAKVVNALLQAAAPQGKPEIPKAIIVPHAGYVYSGPIAASAYARLAAARGTIERVVLLGPVHRVPVRGLALPDTDAFATPFGEIPIDRAAVKSVADLAQIVISGPAHALEHSLEVQLPFLQAVLGEFTLVPLAVGDASPEEVAEVLSRLWGGAETLIVVSSDLSHYLPYEVAKEFDSDTAQAIVEMRGRVNHEQACGGTPVNGLLAAARQHELKAQLLDLRNSGDTAGDRSRVVGYGAFAFFEEESASVN